METPRPDCGAPQLKQRGTKLAPKRKVETIHKGDAIQKQTKKGEAMQGDTIQKKGGDISRADYTPQKRGEIKNYSGETTPPGLFYVRPWVTFLETGWPFYLYTTHTRTHTHSQRESWCFEPSQPLRTVLWLKGSKNAHTHTHTHSMAHPSPKLKLETRAFVHTHTFMKNKQILHNTVSLA